MKIYLYLLLLSGVLCSCSGNTDKWSTDQTLHFDTSAQGKNASCTTPIKDPNHPKPMALMMRMMAANADSMKTQVIRGEKLSVERYPFIRFYLVEPTDTSVLEPKFYENSRLFQAAYNELFVHEKEQTKYFNQVVLKCVNCHESYCNGPLKRIRKLMIDS